jgi:hypothetical protein
MNSYRPVSRLAVASAVVGLLASLSLMTPLLWIIPLVGVALAIAGLADVTRSGAEKAGKVAALAGLALSVGFGMQAVTTSLASRWIKEERARAVVHAWLDALRENRLTDAQSMLSPQLLPESEADAHQHGGPGHAEHDGHAHGTQRSIGSLPAVAAILGCGKQAVPEVHAAGCEETSDAWCTRVRLSPCDHGGPVDVRLQLEPTVVKEPKQRVERWTITQIDIGAFTP